MSDPLTFNLVLFVIWFFSSDVLWSQTFLFTSFFLVNHSVFSTRGFCHKSPYYFYYDLKLLTSVYSSVSIDSLLLSLIFRYKTILDLSTLLFNLLLIILKFHFFSDKPRRIQTPTLQKVKKFWTPETKKCIRVKGRCYKKELRISVDCITVVVSEKGSVPIFLYIGFPKYVYYPIKSLITVFLQFF